MAETKEILIFSELNKKERDHFAHLAHSLSKRCGSIEEFNLSDTTLDVETLLEPKISPFKTISGLSDYLSSISIDNIKSHISSFESLNTRHYESSGSTATNAVVTRINSIISSNSRFTLEQVTHSSYDQKSIIVSYTSTNEDDSTVILSSHLDSTASDHSDAPGADDDASGMAVLIELIRIISDNNINFSRKIEFHFYALEEIGLIGSKAIAESYKDSNRSISSVLQLDMAAYSDDDSMYLVTDDTSHTKTRALAREGNKYIDRTFISTNLKNGGTSDHKSWFNKGYATVFPFENPNSYNPHMHKNSDLFSNLNNFDLLLDIAKLSFIHLSYEAGISLTANQNELESVTNSASLALVENNGAFTIYFASPSGSNQAEFCKIETKDSEDCISKIYRMTEANAVGDYTVFISDEFESGDITGNWRFISYLEDMSISSIRQISIN